MKWSWLLVNKLKRDFKMSNTWVSFLNVFFTIHADVISDRQSDQTWIEWLTFQWTKLYIHHVVATLSIDQINEQFNRRSKDHVSFRRNPCECGWDRISSTRRSRSEQLFSLSPDSPRFQYCGERRRRVREPKIRTAEWWDGNRQSCWLC